MVTTPTQALLLAALADGPLSTSALTALGICTENTLRSLLKRLLEDGRVRREITRGKNHIPVYVYTRVSERMSPEAA